MLCLSGWRSVEDPASYRASGDACARATAMSMCVRVVRHALADLDAVLRIKAVAAAGTVSSLQVRIAYLNVHVVLLAIVNLDAVR